MKKFGLLLCLLLGLTACGQGETYHSLKEIREDIAFYDAEILKEVAFDDYIVFFVAEEQELPEDSEEETGKFFYFRVFQLKKNGEFVQKEHSALVPEGSVLSYDWKELFGDAFQIRLSVHNADVVPLPGDGWWRHREEGDYGKWHFSYEVLKQNDFGAFVPAMYQQEKTLIYR